jgi:FAD:protein FMN transferase
VRWLALLLLLTACSTPSEPTPFAGVRMTLPYCVLIGDPLTVADRDQVWEIIDEVFGLVDSCFNNWNPNSEISKLNTAPAHTAIPLSPQLEELLERAQQVVVLTQGRFDPTVAPLQKLWRASLESGRRPALEQVEELRSAVGWEKLQFCDHSCTKSHAKTALDLCGLSKGYAVDLLVERFNQAGFKNVHVTWGGEICVAGRHPRGRSWNALVASPEGGGAIAYLDLDQQAVATSGDYEQIWSLPDSSFTHICDPHTGALLEVKKGSVASATVIAPTCWLADGLATALMLATSAEEASALSQGWESSLAGVRCMVFYR